MNYSVILGIAAVLCAGILAFVATPLVRVLAYALGAIDVPRDNRRMHKSPVPRMGGLAIFLAFVITTLAFCEYSSTLLTIWFGGLIIVVLGIFDDIFSLNPFVKLLVQIGVALIAVYQGIIIERIHIFGHYISFGIFSIPITIIWITGLINAINLIDGLDGLACGVSAICSVTLTVVTLMFAEPLFALVTAILAGSCIGFLPFNSNPAKIFMGDTGAMFLGYTLSILSIQGLFKMHTVLAFIIPLFVFGLPLLDTMWSFIRRIFSGKSPFVGDKKHIHHRLIAMGFNQKQSTLILYSICGMMGIAAIMFSAERIISGIIILFFAFAFEAGIYFCLKSQKHRSNLGLNLSAPPADSSEDSKESEASKDSSPQE